MSINNAIVDAPGGPFQNSPDNADTCSLDETCSLFTTDSMQMMDLDGYNRPVSMLSYRSSNETLTGHESLTDHEIHIKNRWARINEISKDYEKHNSAHKYINPLRY